MRLKICFLLSCCIATNVFAETRNIRVDSHNSQFEILPGNLLLTNIRSSAGYIDNFLYSEHRKQQTSFLSVTPSVFFQTELGHNLLQLRARSSHFKFNEFSNDDHNTFSVTSKYHYKFDQTKRLAISGHLARHYEYRGTGFSKGRAGSFTEGNDLEVNFINVGYFYGADDSVARAWGLVGQRNYQYLTNRPESNIFDYQGNYLRAGVDYLFSGKSYLTGELAYESLDYQYSPEQTKELYSLLAGAKWQLSVMSKFELLVGIEQAKLDDELFDDKRILKWRVDYAWHPLEYSKLLFSSSRSFDESTQIGSQYKIVDRYKVNVQHDFSDFFLAVAEFGVKRQKVNFTGLMEKENYLYTGLGLHYKRNHRLTFNMKYDFSGLDSTKVDQSFDRNSISVGVTFKI